MDKGLGMLLIALVIILIVALIVYVYTRPATTTVDPETQAHLFTTKIGLPNGTVEQPSLIFGGNPNVGISSNDGGISIST